LTLANGGFIEPVSFELSAESDFLAPVSELQIEITSLAIDYDSEPKLANLSLSLDNAASISSLDIRLLSQGVELQKYLLAPSETISLELPELVSAQDYQLRISAWDINNRLIAVSENDYEFTYLRPQPSILIQSVAIDYETKQIAIQLELEQGDEIASYEVSLFSEGNLRIATHAGEGILPSEIQFPFEELSAQGYYLSLQVFDAERNPLLLEPSTWEFESLPPEKPWYEGLTTLRSDIPFMIAAVLLLLVLIMLIVRTILRPRQRIKVNLDDKKIWADDVKNEWSSSVTQAQVTIDSRLNELPIAVLRVVKLKKQEYKKNFDIKTDNEVIRIGRSTQNNDLAFEDISRVSDKHVIIHQREQRFFIKDVDSRNGTKLGETIMKANEEYELSNRSRIILDPKEESVEIEFIRLGS
jgi:hypothetical protein